MNQNGRKNSFSLPEQWKFRTDPEELGEHFREHYDALWKFDARWMDPEYDDSRWDSIRVPSCWQEEGFDYNGAAWYRTDFKNPLPNTEDERLWVRFHGVDYFADLWINGRYAGSHEGYFSAFEYDITPFVIEGKNNLVLRVIAPSDICAKEKQQFQLKNYLKGALQRWDVNNPLVNPGGIWNRVELYTTGGGSLREASVSPIIMPKDTSGPFGEREDAEVHISTLIHTRFAGGRSDKDPKGTYELEVEIHPTHGKGDKVQERVRLPILEGYCRQPVNIPLPSARLWYPWDKGDPALYTCTIRLLTDNKILDSLSTTFGIRDVRQGKGWETSINGHPIFQRGANYLSDQFLSKMDKNRYDLDLSLAVEANLNTLHPFCVVEKQEFYDACDEKGVLVYQDFPMWLEMSNSSDLVRRALPQMDTLIRQFGHHPSIFVWNCGSQPSKANFLKLGAALAGRAEELDPTRIVHRGNALIDFKDIQPEKKLDPVGDFHWNQDTAEEFAAEYDWRIDSHIYYGWYYDQPMEIIHKVPKRFLELVTEYGAQALPSRTVLEKIIPKESLFPPHWPDYSMRCFQHKEQLKHIELPAELDDFIAKSQEYQARFIKYHTEFYRLHKNDPCKGVHLFCFNDCWDAITWSVIDYGRNPKLGYYALKQAMEPLQAILSLPREIKRTEELSFSLWIVNDLDREYQSVQCLWKARTEEGKELGEGYVNGSVNANSRGEIGSISFPSKEVGAFSIELELQREGDKERKEEEKVTNTYFFTVDKGDPKRYGLGFPSKPSV